VAARTGCDQDQTISTLVDRFSRKGLVDDVVQHDAAIEMHRRIDILARAERRDHDWHLIFYANVQVQVVVQAIIRLVHNLVDRKGR
jgi:hypothetical protein